REEPAGGGGEGGHIRGQKRTKVRDRSTTGSAEQAGVQTPEGLGGGLEPEGFGGAGLDPGGRERRGAVQATEANGRAGREPDEGGGGVEQVVQHLAAGLADQGVVGAG